MKIFCISIFDENFEEFKNLNLIPVGLGKANFGKNWLNDKGLNNISSKNSHFGEYTFHYNLWKNNLTLSNSDEWIGFCSYRRFWSNNDSPQINSYKNLQNLIVREPLKNWNDYDVVLGKPLIFKKIKNMKLIKRNFIEVLKKPTVLFKDNSLMDHFNIFHGSFFLKTALNHLSPDDRNGFVKYLNNYELNPYNMFICKNIKILFKFYEAIFPWLFKCENDFKDIKLNGYDKIRIYGFLAERFMPYWFKKNYKTITCPIIFFDGTNK